MIWTTFCPTKISWELTYVETQGKKASGDWQKHIHMIEESLSLLKDAGIDGMRLVIFPSELTQDGKKFNWMPIKKMLEVCENKKILVDLCIGPFQYPNYPGIYLPPQLLSEIPTNEKYIDTNQMLATYGIEFLQQQLQLFAKDKRIHGFHFANEWPDMQRVSGKESIRIGISKKFMIEAAQLLKKITNKPITLNTNIDASSKQLLANTFTNILTILGSQGKLGFDIYPSQETWRKNPLHKLLRFFEPYHRSFSWSQNKFAPCEITFVEVEAQPWGNGQAWFQLIQAEPDPNKIIRGYSPHSLKKTWKKYITSTTCKTVSLWGADFWLSAQKMGVTWPLEQVHKISTQ